MSKIVENKVFLITYADSISKNLQQLSIEIMPLFGESVHGIHILPPFPSSGDRGFAPLTHLEIDPKQGTWGDINSLSTRYCVSLDLILNHISKESVQFQDYLKNGDNSKFAKYFIDIKRDFPSLLDKDSTWEVRRPRPTPPYLEFETGSGENIEKKLIWCSFSTDTVRQQIDLNYETPEVMELMNSYIVNMCKNGTRLIRLDAAPYIVKKVNTPCFFQPECFEIVEKFAKLAGTFDCEILLEVHSDTIMQRNLAKKGYWVYDFALPYIALHAIFTNSYKNLIYWLKNCPRKQFTTLDTHDGIGAIDAVGLLSQTEIDFTTKKLFEMGGNASMKASGKSSENVDIYQINSTYYSALGRDNKKYVFSRVIQMFTPGIPMVYYTGLLAGENDLELLEETKNGRDINRHYYTKEQILSDLNRPVVKELLKLLEFRNENSDAFDGELSIIENETENVLTLVWENQNFNKKAIATLNFNTFDYSFTAV